MLKLTSALVKYLSEQKLLADGAARQALKSLEEANAAIALGVKARVDTATELNAYPERVRDEDEFTRKE